MHSRFLDKIIDHIDRVDPDNLQAQFLRLAQEKGLFETVLATIHEGLIVVDGEGLITYVNRAAGRLLGFDPDKAHGIALQRYLREIDWTRILDLDGDEWGRMVNREIETNYPEHRFLDFYIVPLAVRDDRNKGAIVMLRDITRERAHAAEAIESERLQAITLLAAGVAHEIGNPLNSLNIHLQLLDREVQTLPPADSEHLGELLVVTRQEVGRLDQIINQFLQAMRPVPLEMSSTHIDALLNETLHFMEQEISDRGVSIELNAPSSLPTVMADRGQIQQVFFNVIKNASQAMTDGGVLQITLAQTDRFVAVAFRDTGEGISPEDFNKIFEPFHTTKSEGSGLGLMIVQRIIRDHGGEMEINNEPGRGVTVTLFLPREDRRMRMLPVNAQRGEK